MYLCFQPQLMEAHLRSAQFNIIWLSGTCLKWSMCYRQRFICTLNHKSHLVLRQGRKQARDALARADTTGISFPGCLVRILRTGWCFPPSPLWFFPSPPPSFLCPQLHSTWKTNSLSSVFLLDFIYVSIRALIIPYFLQTFTKHLTITRHCTGPRVDLEKRNNTESSPQGAPSQAVGQGSTGNQRYKQIAPATQKTLQKL